jgi:hypothetical protein
MGFLQRLRAQLLMQVRWATRDAAARLIHYQSGEIDHEKYQKFIRFIPRNRIHHSFGLRGH